MTDSRSSPDPDAPRAPRRAKPRPSLKMQAIGFLSRREHSRQELRTKLLDSLRKRAREDAALETAADKAATALAEALSDQSSNGIDDAFAPAPPPASLASHTSTAGSGRGLPAIPSADHLLQFTDPEGAVDQLLDWLTANKYLDETRFVESRVNARSRKQGTLRIKLELSRHGLALDPEQAAALRESEFARAQALWQRKFGAVAADARERGKQARFLAARGFAADVVRRIVGGMDEG